MSTIETKPTVRPSPEPARRFAEDTKHTIFQRWTGQDDGVQKSPISGHVDSTGQYVMLLQDGRPIGFTFETVDDIIGLLVSLKEQAIASRRKKGAKE